MKAVLGWMARLTTAWVVVPVTVLMITLAAGLEAFIALDDSMLASLLLANGASGALVAAAYYWLQMDWILLLSMLAASCFAAVVAGRFSWWTLRHEYLQRVTRALVAGWWGLLVGSLVLLWIGAWLADVMLTDDIDITDLQEASLLPALVLFAGLATVIFLRLARMRQTTGSGTDPGSPTKLRSDGLLAVLLSGFLITPGDLPWPGPLQPEPTAMGGRAGAAALSAGQKALVSETLRQGKRAARRMAVDAGRRTGKVALAVTAPARDSTRALARGALIRRNAAEGARRNEIAVAELRRRHPGAEILTERTLLDERGEVVRAAHGGRRLDVVVVERGQVVRVVEVTSPDHNKFAQLSREELVRDAGGNFIRGSDGRLLRARPTDEVMRVDLASRAIRMD